MSSLASVRSERGAVLVEFASVVVTLSLLAFGVTEFGLAWQDKLQVQTAARAGARTGSSLRTAALTDQAVVMAVGSALADVGFGNVDAVLVYKATTADGAVPSGCTVPVPRAVTGLCNLYTGAQVQQVVAGTNSPAWFGCVTGSLDSYWCPSYRQSVQSLGADYLGVWVKARHPMVTKMFGSSVSLTDRAVMRLEPAEG